MPKFIADKPSQESPPEIVPYLGEFLSKYKARGKRWPEIMPEGENHAARWWIDLMEPPREFGDEPQAVERDGQIRGWRTPYHDRLLFSLQKFLGFTEPQQVWIVEHVMNGIPWRGDDGKRYADIIKHHELMKKNPAAFVGQATEVLTQMRKQ